MAAAVLLGNLALLVEASSHRTAMPDRAAKAWHPEAAACRAARRDPPPGPLLSAAIHAKSFHDLPDMAGEAARLALRWRSAKNSKVAASSSAWDGGDGGGEEEDDWEEELRSRLKDLEEMKELEKRAEELQRSEAGEATGDEETEEEKRERVRRELEKVAKEQAERRKTAKLMFELGQKAYGKGMYSRAIEFLEAALTIIPRPTLFGGEIQIWLAMAYEANNRHRDCIALYQQLEKQHPSVSIRKQAAELRYILQAPKLKISKDEMVTIPLIGSSYDRYAATWSDKYKDQEQRRKMATTNPPPSSSDYWGDFLGWRPPKGWESNRAFWVIVTMWLVLITTALLLQR
uniref:Uncharacterized protein LOC105052959 n=1 Tax=Elaeis guineensis var. tenera TaxID=51953 RepID=A0A6I9RUT7_ELAGV|nr:uncharacterized protein LOC105052959 [Elaeis guineensis]